MTRNMIRMFILFALIITGLNVQGQRTYTNLNSAWQFCRAPVEEASEFERINLPHTYNLKDAFDDEAGYYRGKATYKKILVTDSLSGSRRHFLRFGAVNQRAVVYINDSLAGQHAGGYTAFNIDITDHLNYSIDTITVEVDNSHDSTIVPLKGDFTFYGGIYRDVEMISVPATHFSMGHYGSNGVYIRPLSIGDDHCKIRATGYTANPTDSTKVVVRVFNKAGKPVVSSEVSNFEESTGYWNTQFEFDEPVLWSLDSPYLYTFQFSVEEGDRILDQLQVPYGLRYFKFDADKGFSLNGQNIKLIGVNRHQDQFGKGNALTKSDHAKDMYLISQMGVNFLRTAHYPQDPLIVEMCDRLGIAVTMEIPLDHEITYGDAFADNAKTMMLEMIYQYYNHPSIIIWAYMNEMGLGKHLQRDSIHMVRVANLARELEELTRDADPHRYTMIPNHGHFDIYHRFGLTQIPMIVGWNLYYGWYEADFEGFGRFVDHAHAELPDKPLIITEYGAGADPRLTSFDPLRFDFTLDWALMFHRANFRQILDRPFIAGSAVWNMFDFGSEARQDAVPHVNNKGLYSYDRQPKPVSHLYAAHLVEEPVCVIEEVPDMILLTDYGQRLLPISVITNQQSLDVNTGGIRHTFETRHYVAECKVEITNGENHISICGNTVEIDGFDRQSFWAQKDTLRINFGSNFYLQPDDGSTVWLPDQDVPNSFMLTSGGSVFNPRNRGIGTSRPISFTKLDPIYQTMISEVEKLNLTVPPGEYEIQMHFARLHPDKYNCQKITVNGQLIPICNIEPYVAWYRSTEVTVSDDTIEIEFIGDNRETYINGLQIIRK